MLGEECIFGNWKKWLLCFAIASLATILLYNPEQITINLYWFSTVLAISLFAFELLSMVVAVLMLLMFYCLSGISTPDVVFSGWLAPVPWMCLSGMLIGILMEKTNLANRIALLILSKVAKTPLKLFISFFVAGIIICALVPDIITCVIIFMTIASSICKSLELDKNSKESATIILSAFVGCYASCSLYLPNNTGIIGLLIVQQSGLPIEFSWVNFLIENSLFQLIHAIIGIVILYIFGNKALKPHIERCVQEADEQLRKLGLMSSHEKRTLILTVLALAGFVLEPLHKIPGYYLFAFIIFLGFTPLFNVLHCDDIQQVNYSILFFIVGCMAIGFVAGTLGIPAWLSDKIVPILKDIEHQWIANLFAYAVGVTANFLLTPVAAASSLSVPMSQIAVDLGMSIKPILYSFLYGLDQFVLPYELAPALLMFSTGYVRLKYVVILMGLRLLLIPLGIIITSTTLWPLLGL